MVYISSYPDYSQTNLMHILAAILANRTTDSHSFITKKWIQGVSHVLQACNLQQIVMNKNLVHSFSEAYLWLGSREEVMENLACLKNINSKIDEICQECLFWDSYWENDTPIPRDIQEQSHIGNHPALGLFLTEIWNASNAKPLLLAMNLGASPGVSKRFWNVALQCWSRSCWTFWGWIVSL